MRIRTFLVVCWLVCGVLWASQAAGGQQAPAQVQTAPEATPPSGPVSVGLDGQLAKWLQVRGEFRARIEGFTGGGFAANNDDSYWMDRFRLNATIRLNPSIGFVVQAHDARAFLKTAGAQAAPFRDTLDLRMAYGEFGTQTSLRVGRQELAFGEQRLLGHASWLNTARTFDAARVTLKRPGLQIDAFAASVVTIQPDAFDESGSGNALYGAYVALGAIVPNQSIEPYFFWRVSPNVTAETGGFAPLHQATTGVRMAGRLPSNLDYSTEVAVQTGSVGPDSVRAWAGHALVGKTLGTVAWRPRLFAEYNHASGDEDRTDGTRGTFDQLYPSPHDKYGLADQVGWRNINHVRSGIELRPAPKWQLSGGYHSWWLASATDGLFSAGGALVARSLPGTAGRHVGQEADAQVAYVYSSQLQVGAGYAHVCPGQFLEGTTAGAAYNYTYVMVTYVFLGDKPAP